MKKAIWFWVLAAAAAGGLRADLDGDGRVGLADLAILSAEWMKGDSVGTERIVNGDFAGGDANWTLTGTGWSTATGKLVFDEAAGAYHSALQNVSGLAVAGETIRISFDFEIDSVLPVPAVTCRINLVASGAHKSIVINLVSSGRYVFYLLLDGLYDGNYDNLLIECRSTAGIESKATFDNISVQSVLSAGEPIVEQIAQEIAAVIDTVTTAGGYQQTLTAVRPAMLDWTDVTPDNGSVLLVYDDEEDTEQEALGTDERIQRFECVILIIDASGESVSHDTRCARAAADLRKALSEDRTRGGLAIDTFLLSAYFSRDLEFPGIVVPVQVQYRTEYDDPYAAG